MSRFVFRDELHVSLTSSCGAYFCMSVGQVFGLCLALGTRLYEGRTSTHARAALQADGGGSAYEGELLWADVGYVGSRERRSARKCQRGAACLHACALSHAEDFATVLQHQQLSSTFFKLI